MFRNRVEYENELTAVHSYQTRHRNLLRPPIHAHRLYENSFLYQGPRYWNDLKLRFTANRLESMTVSSFKQQVKKTLLE